MQQLDYIMDVTDTSCFVFFARCRTNSRKHHDIIPPFKLGNTKQNSAF